MTTLFRLVMERAAFRYQSPYTHCADADHCPATRVPKQVAISLVRERSDRIGGVGQRAIAGDEVALHEPTLINVSARPHPVCIFHRPLPIAHPMPS